MSVLNLNNNEIMNLKSKFERADINHDGTLQKSEMENLMKENLNNEDMEKYKPFLYLI